VSPAADLLAAGRAPTRVGILGGTFDPPHVAHLVAAVNARHALHLDVVLLVVANEPWQKVGARPVSPAGSRLEMVRAACEGVDGLEPCALEIERGGPSYTVDTLRALGARWPEAERFLILGADAAAGLDSWEQADDLPALCTFVVVDRPGSRRPTGRPGRWEHIEIPLLDIASTDLRARVADGRPLDFLVPPGVLSCIEDLGLYRGSLA
jgi:nicotinate-nucleotide adenylyltransferase